MRASNSASRTLSFAPFLRASTVAILAIVAAAPAAAPLNAQALAMPSGEGGGTAKAAIWHGGQRPVVLARRVARTTRTAARRDDTASGQTVHQGDDKRPPDPLMAIISLGSQHIDVYTADGRLHRSRVSSGTSGHPTPTGVFSVLQRRRYHESNIYSSAPMPYMQRLTWSGIALHEGYVPDYPASHGCIRLPSQFAHTLWGIGRLGMRVVVSPRDIQPVSFNHAKLPRPHIDTSSKAAGRLVRLAAAGDAPLTPEPAATLSPYVAAQLRLTRAIADKAATEKVLKPAFDQAAVKSSEARRLAEALKASAGILADAEEHLEFENFGMATVQTEDAEAVVLGRIRMAEAGVKAAREAHSKLVISERAASEEAFAAAVVASDARTAAETASTELSLARKGVQPITAFISRRTGKVYLRQGFMPLIEEPIAIADPEKPLGTHVLTVMSTSADAKDVSWVAVTMPTSGGNRRRTARRGDDNEVASSASEALERITLPQEVSQILSERLWPGASIIVSDFGLGETGEGTDFVIITN